MKTIIFPLVAAAFSSFALISGAHAGDVTGTWIRDNGESKVKFSACGPALCGVVAWVKEADKQDNVGKRVFYDMVPDGNDKWKGKAFNPEDGKTYTGTMTLSGNKLTTAGCVLGGLICRSINWVRE